MLAAWWSSAPEYLFLLGLSFVVALAGLWADRRR